MENRCGGWPGTRDGNSRTKSFSSRVFVPWALTVGRKPEAAWRTWDRAWATFSWAARWNGFWRRAMAMASSRVTTTVAGVSWAARAAGPDTIRIDSRMSGTAVLRISILLPGLF